MGGKGSQMSATAQDSAQVCQGVNHPHSNSTAVNSREVQFLQTGHWSLKKEPKNEPIPMPNLVDRKEEPNLFVGWLSSGRAPCCEWPTVGSRRLLLARADVALLYTSAAAAADVLHDFIWHQSAKKQLWNCKYKPGKAQKMH